MADVFISYSQALPEPTEALASDLGAQGYAYWYDTRLLPTDVFWRVIMKRIIDAKAVIVIWSPPAVNSDWVYGEAKLAHEQKKLVCVRTDDVAPASVPIPFNGYNVSPLNDRTRIFQALGTLGVPTTAQGGFLAQAGDPALALPALAAADREAGEIALAWAEIRDSDDPEDFEAFLEHYGDAHAFFARMAQKRRARLRGAAPPVVPLQPAETGRVIALPAAARDEVDSVAEDVQLRIDPGMHTAAIKRISLSADGRLMATASDDKTVRLWALPEGRLVRTLRPAIGPGNDGKVFATALSPDGSWAAAGGWNESGAHYVSIFDTASGAVTARLGPLPNVINDLEVSPDGRRLAAGLGGDNGIRVWEFTAPLSASPEAALQRGYPGPSPLSSGEGPGSGHSGQPAGVLARGRSEGGWHLAFEDWDCGDDIYGLAFAVDGRLATTSLDGGIRLYAPDGMRIARARAPGGAQPYGIAISPDGTRVAVGYADTTRVDVLDSGTLAPLFAADTTGVGNGNLIIVAWSADGARLAAAGRYQVRGKSPILVWADGGRGARRALPGPSSTVMDLAAWGDGFAFGAGDPAFGLLDGAGGQVLRLGSPLADLRNKLSNHFLVSADGRRVRFGLEQLSGAPVLLDLAGPSLTPSPNAPPDLKPADTTSLSIDGWINTTALTLKVKHGWLRSITTSLRLEPYETARSLAIAPDGKSFILGTEWLLRRFDAAGVQQWEQPVPGIVWGVNLARDGRLVIAAYGDGTIRWHRAADGAELLACFIHVDWSGDEPKPVGWVVWTPKGHYSCAPGSQDLIGWHVNRGEGEAADFYPASTFAATFHKPDVVARALDEL